MKHAKTDKHRRAKAIGVAAAALVVGIGLLVLSQMVIASGRKAAEAATTQAASAPAATDTQPASTTPADKKPAADPKAVAAQRMGNLLLLFSLMSFGVTIAGVAWVIYDVRRSRPAWMTQTRYPAHQRRK